MELNEEMIHFLEGHFPEWMGTAIQQAYWQALASGSSVLVARNGEILEVFPDGSEKIIKRTLPFVSVQKGKIILLR